ncbi:MULTISPECIES: glycoside hydrolase family 64 protein [unclassified Nocardiopsis]|uniref:glycoside hydrolase family 64 protein n=1 Tax=unclassified Nocardiopsis TaxID=2649073 RepID=UPI00135886AA|nr:MULTISPECIES: glycoside hydrolase family 64 protein [unclassified Nocardiopsis]
MIDRRLFLGGASLAAVGGPLLAATGCSSPSGNAELASSANPGALPVTVSNETGAFSDNEVLVYVVGTDLTTDRQCWVDADGTPHPVSESDNTDDGYTDYAIPLDSASELSLPFMSGRVYFALGGKLRFRVVADGNGRPALQYPAGWVESDPSHGVLHDTVEFTHDDTGMYCNTSMVDQFSVPLGIRLLGEADQTTGTFRPGGRDAVFEALSADPDFSPLVVGGGERVISPGHGLDAGLFRADFYDAYIDEVWARYSTTDLRVTTNAGTFTGRVDGSGALVFDGGVTPIAKPTTRDVFFCDGALHAPNDGITGPVAAILGAAFNRSTLLDSAEHPVTGPAAFYRHGTTNRYAAALHANTEDGKAYGFAFDDVSDFASYVQDHAPVSLHVTLTPF